MQTTQATTLNLGINCSSLAWAAPLIDGLRLLGQIIHPIYLTTTESLEIQLKQSIDIILTQPDTEQASVESLIAQLKLLKKSTPTLMLINDYQAELVRRGFEAGIQDVIVITEIRQLAAAITREMNLLKARKMNFQLNQRITDISGRYKALAEQLKENSSLNTSSSQNSITLIENSFKTISKPDPGSTHYFFYAEVDPFDELINRIGFQEISSVLREVEQLIEKYLPQSTSALPFNERAFIFFLTNSNQEKVTELAKILLKNVTEHLYETKEHTLQLSLRIGITEINFSEKNTPIDFINNAFRATHKISSSGHQTNQFQFFQSGEKKTSNGWQTHEDYLKNALLKEQLHIVFQPIIQIDKNDQEIYEALLRITDDNGNEVSRDTLFNMVEKANFAEQLDQWVIIQAIKTLSNQRIIGRDTHLFINISPASMTNPDFAFWLQKILLNEKIGSNLITLQINENDAIEHLKQATLLTKNLQKIGCNIAISQFKGTEASLNLLPHLNANTVKLDARFTHTLLDSEQNRKTLYALVKTLHDKKITVLASQIEGARVLAPLWHAQVDYLQGYYFQAPQEEMNYPFKQDH